MALVVNAGPPRIGYVNGVFTSVTICVPGTTTCQTIDDVLVDTGSIGLRVLSRAAGGELDLDLPSQRDEDGAAIAECGALVDSYLWGSLRFASVVMGAEPGVTIPIQLVGDPDLQGVPASCSASGGVSADTLADLGANAILGVGPLTEDCGAPCSDPPAAPGSENPGNVYYACAASGCGAAAVAMSDQLPNPVGRLADDNNGVVVDLSGVSPGGAPTATGTLYLGIATRDNNVMAATTVIPIDAESLTFTTVYLGKPYAGSFLDTGSNGYYFLSPAQSGLPTCSGASSSPGGYYCPSGMANVEVTNRGANGADGVVAFRVANAEALLSVESNYVFDDLAGPSESGGGFDFGLPFFLGRRVFSSIEVDGKSPYVAY
jgi:hypothetical protein